MVVVVADGAEDPSKYRGVCLSVWMDGWMVGWV